MNDDCIRAQELISRAADHDHVTPEDAAWAKRHCAECAECASFVTTLVRIKRTPAPRAPESAVAATLSAVEQMRASSSPTEPVDDGRSTPTGVAPSTETPPPTSDATVPPVPESGHPPEINTAPTTRRSVSAGTVAAWVAGTAAVLVAAMFVTAQGLRYIGGQSDSFEQGPVNEVTLAPQTQDPAEDRALDSGAVSGEMAAPAPPFVEFDGYVYRALSTVSDEDGAGARVGSTRTSLDQGGPPVQRTVYEATAERSILLDTGAGLLECRMVTRVANGRVYGLRTDSLTVFGEWPTMPSRIPRPVNPSGGPAFVEAGEVDGVTIYVRPGQDTENGFAVAPGTAPTDPASGSPEWTWWEPLD